MINNLTNSNLKNEIIKLFNDNEINLSRFLYPIHYIKDAIICSMIYKRDFNEVIFWVCEFYHSGYYYKSWELLHLIYYCFYSLTCTDFGNRIDKLYDKWKHKSKIMETFILQLTNTNTHFTANIPSHYNLSIQELHTLNIEMLEDIIYCYKNLHIKQHNDIIYSLYYSLQTKYNKNNQLTFNKNKQDEFLTIFNTQNYNNFSQNFYELFNKDFNISVANYPTDFTHFLSILLKNIGCKLHKNIIQFFDSEIIVSFNNMIHKELFNYLYVIGYVFNEFYLINREKSSQNKPNLNKSNKQLHIQLNTSQNELIQINSFITPFTDFINKYKIICSQDKIFNIHNYNLLKKNHISFIQLPTEINHLKKYFQFKNDTLFSQEINKEILWYYWDIFAFNTPIWNSRFNHYHSYIDITDFNICFKTDDLLEQFHDLYNYEIDEQPKEIYNNFILI